MLVIREATKLGPAGQMRPAESFYLACHCTVQQISENTIICKVWNQPNNKNILQKSWN